MELKAYLSLLNKRKAIIALFVVIALTLAIILIVIQPFKYSSGSQVLVIQNSSSPDPYQASKSTEYLSNVLAKVVNSNSFFENVLNSGYFIDKNYFGDTVKERMKIWDKTVSAKAINDSGIISIEVYHPNRSQAESIAQAVVYTLQTKHGLYHGNGNNVSVKVLDNPITSNYPVKPNLFLYFALALVFGSAFSLIYIYLFPEEKYNIKLFQKKAKQPVSQIVESVEPEAYKLNDWFAAAADQETENNNFNGYDDLNGEEKIELHGSMKNIFGKSYQDDL